MTAGAALALVHALDTEFEQYAGLRSVALELRDALLAGDTAAVAAAAEQMDALAEDLLRREAERELLARVLCPEPPSGPPRLAALVAVAGKAEALELQRAGSRLGAIAAELKAINEANVVLLRRAAALGQRRLRLLQGLPLPAYQADGSSTGLPISARAWVA